MIFERVTIECDRCHNDETFDGTDEAIEDGWYLGRHVSTNEDLHLQATRFTDLCEFCVEELRDEAWPGEERTLAGHPNSARALPPMREAIPRRGPTLAQGEVCPACGLIHFWRSV